MLLVLLLCACAFAAPTWAARAGSGVVQASAPVSAAAEESYELHELQQEDTYGFDENSSSVPAAASAVGTASGQPEGVRLLE